MRVDPDEDLRDLFLVSARSEFDDLKSELPQISHPINPIFKSVYFFVVKLFSSTLTQPSQKITDNRPVAASPQYSYVGDEFGVSLDSSIGHLKSLIGWPEGY